MDQDTTIPSLKPDPSARPDAKLDDLNSLFLKQLSFVSHEDAQSKANNLVNQAICDEQQQKKFRRTEPSILFKIQHKSNVLQYLMDLVHSPGRSAPEKPPSRTPCLDYVEISRCIFQSAALQLLPSSLQILRIRSCGLDNPAANSLAKSTFPQLEQLDLSHNRISVLPFFKFRRLKVLNVSHNCLHDVDFYQLAELRQLHDLDISSNRLDYDAQLFGDVMGNLRDQAPRLRSLALKSNPMCRLIPDFARIAESILGDTLEFLDHRRLVRDARKQSAYLLNKAPLLRASGGRGLRLETLELPMPFSDLTRIVNACLERPNMLMMHLKSLMQLVDHLILKSKEISQLFSYRLSSGENSLERELQVFLDKAASLVEQNPFIESALFDVLVKLIRLDQPSLRVSEHVFAFLFALMNCSGDLRAKILDSIANESFLCEFVGPDPTRLNLTIISRCTQLVTLGGPVERIFRGDFYPSIQNWLIRIVQMDWDLGLDFDKLTTLADFAGIVLFVHPAPPRFAALMKELFYALASKLNFYEDLERPVLAAYLFFLKLTKHWLQVDSLRASESSGGSRLQSPARSLLSETAFFADNSRFGVFDGHSEKTLRSENRFFLLEENTYAVYVDHVWRFFVEIAKNLHAKQISPRCYLEVFNLMTNVLSKLMRLTPAVDLESDPYNFPGGVNMFTHMIAFVSEQNKHIELKTILFNLASKLFYNK